MQNDTLALIQEPWINNVEIIGIRTLTGRFFYYRSNEKPRNAIYAPSQFIVHPLAHLPGSDLTVVKIRCANNSEQFKNVILTSVYLPTDTAIPPPNTEIEGPGIYLLVSFLEVTLISIILKVSVLRGVSIALDL